MEDTKTFSRRKALGILAGSAGFLASGSAVANMLRAACGLPTPAQTEGPFYPEKDQADKDWDLTQVKGGTGRALGQVIYIHGVVQDEQCNAISGALVEIWQACAAGSYNHSADPNPAPRDPNFQYWGRAVTDEKGRWMFKTIIPGAYPADETWWRPPHVHVKVHKLGFLELTSQLYFEGEPLNEQDKILQRIPAAQRKTVITKLEPAKSPEYEAGSKVGSYVLTIEHA